MIKKRFTGDKKYFSVSSTMDQVETPARFNQQVLIFVFGLIGVILMILLVYLIKRYLQIEATEQEEIGQSRKHHDLTLKKSKQEEAAKKREAVEVHKMKKSISSSSSSTKSSQIYSIIR